MSTAYIIQGAFLLAAWGAAGAAYLCLKLARNAMHRTMTIEAAIYDRLNSEES